LTFDRKPQEYQTVFDLTNEDYNKLVAASRLGDSLRHVRDKLKAIEADAAKAAKALDPFLFEDFEKDYILNNPLFYQRKSLSKPSCLLPTYLTGAFMNIVSRYLGKRIMSQGGYCQFTFITLTSFCRNTGSVRRFPIKCPATHF